MPATALVNISGRAVIDNGTDTLAAGLVIAGPTSEEVLIRGVGPTLGGRFHLGNAIAATQVTLYDSKGDPVTSNATWGDNPAIVYSGTWVGAFPLMPHSRDSALLVTLAPGSYTVQVAGQNGSTGLALVEIYEVK